MNDIQNLRQTVEQLEVAVTAGESPLQFPLRDRVFQWKIGMRVDDDMLFKFYRMRDD